MILRPLSPKTGYHFFEGGGSGGGVKSVRSEGSKPWGDVLLSHHRWSNGNTADAQFSVGGSNPGRPTAGGVGGTTFAPPGFEPPTKKSAVGCITIRPLLTLRRKVSPLLGATDATDATDKKPKLCVSV